jgi:alcohol dehydrogenase
MKAAIYHGPEDIRLDDIADARLEQDHAMLVEVSATSICGSDLHLYRGAMDAFMERGKSQIGHELVGIVREVGAAISKFSTGDRVSMAYSCSCGSCYMCEVGQTAHCETTQKAVYGFGVPFGNLNGTHAEAMVLPHADAHAIKITDGIPDNAALLLSCNLPTAIIANELASIQPGESVAIVGAGPTGLMCLDLALQKFPGAVCVLEPVAHRRELVIQKGVQAINSADADACEQAMVSCSGRGFDKVIEVVGSGTSLRMSLDIIRPGGTIAAMGVFTEQEFNLVLADVFLRDISLHMNGFANVQPYMEAGQKLLEAATIDPDSYFSHEYSLSDIDQAFLTFSGKLDNAKKMIIRP